jgi:hypothetical protein
VLLRGDYPLRTEQLPHGQRESRQHVAAVQRVVNVLPNSRANTPSLPVRSALLLAFANSSRMVSASGRCGSVGFGLSWFSFMVVSFPRSYILRLTRHLHHLFYRLRMNFPAVENQIIESLLDRKNALYQGINTFTRDDILRDIENFGG